MRAESLKGHLDGMLLAVLEDGPRHGYAVMEVLRASSGGRFDLPTGTIYPALHRLERAGLVHTSWTEAGGRRRRLYELTQPAGVPWTPSGAAGGSSRPPSPHCWTPHPSRSRHDQRVPAR